MTDSPLYDKLQEAAYTALEKNFLRLARGTPEEGWQEAIRIQNETHVRIILDAILPEIEAAIEQSLQYAFGHLDA